jgi:hypothetical protein
MVGVITDHLIDGFPLVGVITDHLIDGSWYGDNTDQRESTSQKASASIRVYYKWQLFLPYGWCYHRPFDRWFLVR